MRGSFTSLLQLIRHFAVRQRLLLVPLLVVVLLALLLLAFTSGISYVAPFVYTLF